MPRKIEIPALSAAEIVVAEKMLEERFGWPIPVKPGDAEIQLHRSDRELAAPHPVINWNPRRMIPSFSLQQPAPTSFAINASTRDASSTVPEKNDMAIFGNYAFSMLQLPAGHERKRAMEEGS